MQQFSTKECQIIWAKKCTLQQNNMQAIKTELVSMQPEIQEALEFTKKLRDIGHSVEVKFWFNEDLSKDCWLVIYYEKSCEAWVMLLVDKSDKTIGEIASQNPLTMAFIEKDDILKQEIIE